MILLGARGERAAERMLRSIGYRIAARNHRCAAGEIDLIAIDGDTVVFVEVKTRSRDDAAFPEANVTMHKRRKLTQVARSFVAAKNLHHCALRFDVVAVVLEGRKPPMIEHFINAFEPLPR